MATTIVHAADVHLETVFPDVRGGGARRAALADAFERIVDLALERNADVLTIGGDLYESERAGPATRVFSLPRSRASANGCSSRPAITIRSRRARSYARDDLPPNVRVFATRRGPGVPLAPDVTLYGFGHTPAEPGRPFAGAAFDRSGVRIALVHGSDEERCPPGKRATAPFTRRDSRSRCDAHAHRTLSRRLDRERRRGARLRLSRFARTIKFGETRRARCARRYRARRCVGAASRACDRAVRGLSRR